MRSIHPKPRQAVALVAASWLACAGGCRNQPSGLPNPFLAPNRVPPPATRALLPGQAEPYYPGDPLPVMQSSVQPGAAPTATSNSPAPTQPTSNDGLSWGTSGVASAASVNPGTTRATNAGLVASNPSPGPAAKSSEPAVAVPTDGDSLRFPLPAPVAAVAPQSQGQLASAPTTPTVVPAAYLAPVSGNQSAATVTQLGDTTPPSTGPWRSPQLAPSSSAAIVGVPTTGVIQPSSMDVRRRAVSSPPPETVPPTTPRIRIPAYGVVPTTTGASTLPQPAMDYATPSLANPPLQTVQIGQLPQPPTYTTASGAVPQSAVASADGFRPRSYSR